MFTFATTKSRLILNLSKLRGSFTRSLMAGISIYEGDDFSLNDIKNHLSQFPGGSVDLKLDDKSGIAMICLNNPDKKNAITGKMMVDLEKAVGELEGWKTGKGLLMYGSNNIFCSGGDLEFAKKTGSPEGGYKMAKFMQHVLTRLQKLPLITAAFIEGFVLGGGCELAISLDYRLFKSDATAGFVHARMGIIPAWGGLTTAVQVLGYQTALDLMTTARLVKAEEARQIGLCDAIVDDLSAAQLWLAERTVHDSTVVRAVKTVASYCRQAPPDDALQLEMKVFSPLWGGPANKHALSQKLKHK